MCRKNIPLYFFIIFNFSIYIILSIIMNRGLFTSETDGFFYQIMVVSNGDDLGVLSIIHQLRYIVVYPLVKLEDFNFNYLQPLFLFFYLMPLLMQRIPNHTKIFSLFLLYFSLFFSYRTIIVMLSIYIIVLHIKYNVISKKVIFLSLFYSLLSSGVFLFYFLLIYRYKNIFIKNKYVLKYSFFVFSILLLITIPSVLHKILFFIDPYKFASAKDVTFDALSSIGLTDIQILFYNIFERSMLNEAYLSSDFIRLSILLSIFLVFLFLFLVFNNKLIYFLFILYLISLLFEGLMAYSLFFSILFLFYDYMYRSFKRSIVCQKKY